MLSAALCLALLAPQGGAPVVINEFSYDDTSTDDREFVELYNASGTTQDISNWRLESMDENGPNTTYTIPANTMLAPGAFWVMGHPSVANVNQVLGSPPHENLFENSDESLTLVDSLGNIIDTLVYERNKNNWTPAANLIEGDGIWGNFTSVDGRQTSWSRIRDGRDTGSNGLDFFLMPDSPGTSNNATLGFVLPYFDNFDTVPPETPLPITTWIGSFDDAFTVDPTVVGTYNPNAIPASPTGGNAAVFWDIAGGGNSYVLRSEITTSTSFEAYVYVDATPQVDDDDFEYWSVGFGTTCTFSNVPPMIGNPNFTANANTGVSWTYVRTATSTSLFLVDHNDGGWGSAAGTSGTILGTVPIIQGSNDGWQRLRIELNVSPTAGNSVIGSFGGTLACADGTTFSGRIGAITPTTLFVGYRQNDGAPGVPSTVRPFTADDILIRSSSSTLAIVGSPAPTNSGTPTLNANGPPTIGNAGFALTASGLVPSVPVALFIGTPLGPPGFPLSSIGGQPGSELLVNTVVAVSIPVDPAGNMNLPIPIACNPLFVGALISWQLFNLDLTLPFALPLGNSARLDTTFGL